jgi:hypothetical protein
MSDLLVFRFKVRDGPGFDDETVGRPGLATVSRSERRAVPSAHRVEERTPVATRAG